MVPEARWFVGVQTYLRLSPPLLSSPPPLSSDRIFEAFDAGRRGGVGGSGDSDGLLSKTEFRHVLTDIGVELSQQQAEELWKALDKNDDGAITFAEFMPVIKEL